MKGFILSSLLALTITGLSVYTVINSTTSTTNQQNVTYYDRLSKIAEEINSSNTTWKATTYPRYKLLQSKDSTIKAYLGSKRPTTPEQKARWESKRVTYPIKLDLSTNFDSRTKWPMCESINDVRDQSNCGSCWAVSSASAISDRICIASNQQNQTRISSNDINSCCTECGNGCDGGEEDLAFRNWTTMGYVTGNEYGGNEWCSPYPFETCAHHVTVPEMKSCTE